MGKNANKLIENTKIADNQRSAQKIEISKNPNQTSVCSSCGEEREIHLISKGKSWSEKPKLNPKVKIN